MERNIEHLASRICENAEKRIRTTMIGSLSKVENAFGHLWGHFSDGELTEQQENFADLWDFVRNQILNQGNKQIRHLKEDISKIIGVNQHKSTLFFKMNNISEERDER